MLFAKMSGCTATYKRWLLIVTLWMHFYNASVYAAHFRGGVIMIRPKLGGAAKEVSS